MESKCETIRGENGEIGDIKATIIHEGREYSCGGAWIGIDPKTGKMGGMLYASEDGTLVNWDGTFKIDNVRWGRKFRGPFGDSRVHCWFSYVGRNFFGRYYGDYTQIVRVREVKNNGKNDSTL